MVIDEKHYSNDFDNMNTILVFVGASGTGKTTITRLLEEQFDIKRVVTTTTRKPRENEIEGIDYHFVSTEEFGRIHNNKGFVEFTKYSGNFYGTEKSELDKHTTRPVSIIMDLDGAKNLAKLYPDRVAIIWIESGIFFSLKNMIKRKEPFKKMYKRLKFAIKNKEFKNPIDDFKDVRFLPLFKDRTIEEKINLVYLLMLKIEHIQNLIYYKQLEKEKELNETSKNKL